MSSTTLRDVQSPSAFVREEEHAGTRREMVAEAVDGVARFKKSRISVIILKGGLAMGQVIALVTLLILASILPYPFDSDYPPQSTPSNSCPHPELFQSWMAVNAFRLSLCWAVSCWMLLRDERARIRAEDEEFSLRPRLSPSTSDSTLATQRPLSVVRNQSPSSGSSSGGTALNTPVSIYEEYPRPDEKASSSSSLGRFSEKDAPVSRHTGPETRSQEFDIQRNTPAIPDTTPRRRGPDSEDLNITRSERLAITLDIWAPRISKSLGVLSAILFVLGNVLLFYPPPHSDGSCYDSAPLLWWGVMSVIGVGWILVLQVVAMAFGIGIGGPIVLTSLRKLGVIPPPPIPEPPRPPQSDPLSHKDLSKIKLVTFIPTSDPSLPPHSIPTTTTSGDTTQSQAKILAPWEDLTRLPYPPHYLPSHQTTCAICQDGFSLPVETGRKVLLDVSPLRLLGCGHVYHMECVDRWLTTGSGNCPTCNRSVRDWF